MPSVLLLLFAVLFAGPAAAAVYRHPGLGLVLNVPPGWMVRVAGSDGVRVLPPKQEDRERGGVDVRIVRQALPGGLPALAARLRRADGAREAAQTLRLDKRSGRLLVSYREGRYVQNGLWIVSQRLVVWQQAPKQRYIKAQCTANAAEYSHYRRAFADLCQGMTLAVRAGGRS